MKTIRIGAGASDLDYLVFECLAERTIALAQQAKMKDPRKSLSSLMLEFEV